jgi:hypothetical protein
LTGFGSADSFGGFGGADGLVFAPGYAALVEELKDGGFEGLIGVGGLVATAGFGTVLDDVPVAGLPGRPMDGAAAGLAELVLVRGDAVGLGFAVGHEGSCEGVVVRSVASWGKSSVACVAA